jgi:hypothetical protein
VQKLESFNDAEFDPHEIEQYEMFWSSVQLRDKSTGEIVAVYCPSLQQPHSFAYNSATLSSPQLAQQLLRINSLSGRVCHARSKQQTGRVYSWGYHFSMTYKSIIQSPWNLATKECRNYNDFLVTYAQHCVLSSYALLAPEVAEQHLHRMQTVRTVLNGTPFTACSININAEYAPHRDKRDLPGTITSCKCNVTIRRIFCGQLLSIPQSCRWHDLPSRIQMHICDDRWLRSFAKRIQHLARSHTHKIIRREFLSFNYCMLYEQNNIACLINISHGKYIQMI